MAKLSIKTDLNSVVIVGEFCKWSVNAAKRVYRKNGGKYINIDDMPIGEYRVLSCESYLGGEIYPTDNRQMSNRYFSGEINEVIRCYFN